MDKKEIENRVKFLEELVHILFCQVAQTIHPVYQNKEFFKYFKNPLAKGDKNEKD